MLLKRIDELRVSREFRKLATVDMKDYIGIRVANDKSRITMGAKEEIQIYRYQMHACPKRLLAPSPKLKNQFVLLATQADLYKLLRRKALTSFPVLSTSSPSL